MASFRKINNKWIAEISKKGFRKSKRFDSKAKAQQWALDIEATLNGDISVGTRKNFADACDKYANEVAPTHKGYKYDMIRLNRFKKYKIANKQIQKITKDDINAIIVRRLTQVTKDSVKREMETMRSVFKYAFKEWKWINKTPFQEITLPKKSPPRDRRISDDEIERILKALYYSEEQVIDTSRYEVAIAFLLAIETAMRQGEIFKCEWTHIHLEKCYLSLFDTKNGTNRNVPLSKRAVELIKKLKEINGNYYKMIKVAQETAGQIFRRAVILAGIENLRFHDTRHESLTRLARKLDVLDLARMVGHNDPRSLMIYYNATATEIASRLD